MQEIIRLAEGRPALLVYRAPAHAVTQTVAREYQWDTCAGLLFVGPLDGAHAVAAIEGLGFGVADVGRVIERGAGVNGGRGFGATPATCAASEAFGQQSVDGLATHFTEQ